MRFEYENEDWMIARKACEAWSKNRSWPRPGKSAPAAARRSRFFFFRVAARCFLLFFAHLFLNVFLSLFPKASPMLGFSFSLLDWGVERDRTGPWCGRDLGWWSGMGVIRDGCDTGWVWYGMGVRYGMLWKMEERWYGMGVIRDGCDIRDVVEDGGAVLPDGCDTGRVWYTGCCGRWRSGVDGGKRMGVWMEHGGGARLGTGVDKGMDGRWRGARLGVDGCGWGCGWKTEGSETEFGLNGERDWVWTRVDGRRRGARLGVDGCGRGFGWEGVDACGRGCGWKKRD